MPGKSTKEGRLAFLSNFNHPVQDYSNTLPYMLGGLTLVCIVLLFLSGIYMALFYVPTPSGAYGSTLNMIQNVPFGGFARSVHFWTSNIIVLLIALHIARIIITGSYKKPRRLLYFVGLLMLFTVLAIMYLGTILPMDQIGTDAAIRFQQIAMQWGINIPISEIIGPTQVLHINVLILVLITLLGIHMYLIEKLGISPKSGKKTVSRATAGEGKSTFLSHLTLLAGAGLLLTAGIGALALLMPAGLGHPGVYDPSVMITKPVETLFFVNDIMLDYFGTSSLLWGPLLLFALLLAFPILDRSKYTYWRRRIPFMLLGLFILGWAIYFISVDALNPTTFNGAFPTPVSNATIAQAITQNAALANTPGMYYVSNGTAAGPADVYGGFVNIQYQRPSEVPVIAAALAVLAGLGAAILIVERRKHLK